MIKFINILSKVISEQKRYKLSPEDYTKLLELTERLWSLRNKNFPRKIEVDQMEFKTADGSEGKFKVFLNPRYKNYAQMDLKPRTSLNPKRFEMQLNPKLFGSKKNLFLTLYHEIMHATDPQFTTRYTEKYFSDYDPEVDEKYWGHPIEFRAVTNEFLEGLINEFKRRNSRTSKIENKKLLLNSLANILNHFSSGKPLSKLSLDIINRMSDENLRDNRIADLIANISTDYPETSGFMSNKKPQYLTLINNIKTFSPDTWSKFLKMLYHTGEEIKDIISVKN